MIDDGCGRPLQFLPRPQRKERSRLLTVYYHISPSALRLSLLISRSDVCGVVSVSSQSFAALDWCQALAQSRPSCWMGKHTFFSPAFPFAGKKKLWEFAEEDQENLTVLRDSHYSWPWKKKIPPHSDYHRGENPNIKEQMAKRKKKKETSSQEQTSWHHCLWGREATADFFFQSGRRNL